MNQTTLFQEPTAAAPKIVSTTEAMQLIYGNGPSSPATIVFHEDGGHGWLQVPLPLLKKLGIEKKITGYSYRDKENAYLEEDCDLSTFMAAIFGLYPENREQRQQFFKAIPQEYKDYSPIRNLRSYK